MPPAQRLAITFITFLAMFGRPAAQPAGINFFKPRLPQQVQVIDYPFYNGVRMFEIDSLGWWEQRVSYYEITQPRAMPHSALVPRPGPNVYLFCDTNGRLLKAFNYLGSKQPLEDLCKKMMAARQQPGHLIAPQRRHSYGGGPAFTPRRYAFAHQIAVEGHYRVYSDTALRQLTAGRGRMWEADIDQNGVGLIDSLGNLAVPIHYQYIQPAGKYLLVRKNKFWGLMDMQQRFVIPAEYDEVKEEQHGIFQFLKARAIHLVYDAQKNKLSTLNAYDEIVHPESEATKKSRFTAVQKDGKTGFVDAEMREIISPQYEICDNFFNMDNPLIRVMKNGQWGYLNRQLQTVAPCIYQHAEPFENGRALVHLNGEWFYLDEQGERLDAEGGPAVWEKVQEVPGCDLQIVSQRIQNHDYYGLQHRRTGAPAHWYFRLFIQCCTSLCPVKNISWPGTVKQIGGLLTGTGAWRCPANTAE